MWNIVWLIICGMVLLGFFVVIGGCVISIIWGVVRHFHNQAKDRAEHQKWLLNEERQREREELERIRELESTIQEYRGLIDVFARLVSDGSSPWDELMRTARALYGGTGSISFEETVMNDVKRVLVTFAIASGNVPNGLGRLYYALCEKQSWGGGWSEEVLYGPRGGVRNFIRRIESIVEDGQHKKPAGLPSAVEPLSAFDKLRKTHLAAYAADAYCLLVIRASECCSASMAVDALRTRYLTLLQPYVSAASFQNGGQSSSGNHNSAESGIQFNGNCPKCTKYFPVLRLNPDAGEQETKNAYRNFVKIYHPDRFEGKSERQTAEAALKEVNEAYSHIIGHFEAAASKGASAGGSQ